ncbi:MAG: zf-HC2 domain-containing protein [Acidobacteria bacterium]|nr:zf-HC2 domain-containing protein [Acidobacteriota bacterium]
MERNISMQHAEFEALMSDALDGLLAGEAQQRFESHRAECRACALMFREAEAGMRWLATLEEAAPPAHLVHNIMVATIGRPAIEAAEIGREGWLQRLRGLGVQVLQPMLQPRFALSFAMAFFAISAALSLGGVRLNHLSAAQLAPGTLANNALRSLHETTARAEKYYDNLRVVYELESRYRELRNSIPDANEAPRSPQQEQKTVPNKNKSSSEQRTSPERQQYTREQRDVLIAGLMKPNIDFAGPALPRMDDPAVAERRVA